MPHVAVRVDEPGRNNLIGTINHDRALLSRYVPGDSFNQVTANQEIRDNRVNGMAFIGVNEKRSVLEEDTTG